MKKSIRMVAAFVAVMSLTACTGSTNANTSEEDSLAVVTLSEGAEAEEVVNVLEKEVEAGDAPSLNKAVETIQAELQEIIESGDAEKAAACVAAAREERDSLGGVVECRIEGVPAGCRSS